MAEGGTLLTDYGDDYWANFSERHGDFGDSKPALIMRLLRTLSGVSRKHPVPIDISGSDTDTERPNPAREEAANTATPATTQPRHRRRAHKKQIPEKV